MKRMPVQIAFWISLFLVFVTTNLSAALREENPGKVDGPVQAEGARAVDPMEAMEEPEAAPKSDEMIGMEAEPMPKPVKKIEKGRKIDRADSFVAGADWEFDGFVSGGQDEGVKSMYYQGDLVYLNIGSQQGVAPGERLAFYKRGNKIKDPQSGKFIGYEVRRAAFGRASDRVDSDTSSVRIVTTFEPVEIGDLVRRE